MNEREKADSVTRSRAGITADARLFEGARLRLGAIVVLTVPVWLLVNRLVAGPGAQLLSLAAYGLLGMAWIVWHAWRELSACAARQRAGDTDEAA